MTVFIGTTGNDNISSSANYDSLYGITGNDTLGSSVVGFDYWDGGQGNDYLYAQWGSQAFGTFNGGDGNDSIQMGNYSTTTNTVYTGSGNDTVESAAHYGLTDISQDKIFLGDGNDLVWGSNGNSFYVAGTGTDTIHMGNGNDSVWADTGALNTQIYEGSGSSQIWIGDRGASTLTQIFGGAGNATVNGENDQGILWAAAGSGTGVNVIIGGGYSNHMYGNNANGQVWLRGGVGTDEYVGGHAANYFIATPGGDFMTGGGTSNSFMFNELGDAGTHINNFNVGTDHIGLYAQNFSGLTAGETLTPGYNLINDSGPVANTATMFDNGGLLYFDADGTGGGAAPVLLAALGTTSPLSPGNFFISGTRF
jgi:Ca2+-binding RTX toxin-like protein